MSTGVRQQRAAATRRQLITAGLSLAERTGLAGMSVNLIVAEAGVAKGTFFHHFRDRSQFLLALHTELFERLKHHLPKELEATRAAIERRLAA